MDQSQAQANALLEHFVGPLTASLSRRHLSHLAVDPLSSSFSAGLGTPPRRNSLEVSELPRSLVSLVEGRAGSFTSGSPVHWEGGGVGGGGVMLDPRKAGDLNRSINLRRSVDLTRRALGGGGGGSNTGGFPSSPMGGQAALLSPWANVPAAPPPPPLQTSFPRLPSQTTPPTVSPISPSSSALGPRVHANMGPFTASPHVAAAAHASSSSSSSSPTAQAHMLLPHVGALAPSSSITHGVSLELLACLQQAPPGRGSGGSASSANALKRGGGSDEMAVAQAGGSWSAKSIVPSPLSSPERSPNVSATTTRSLPALILASKEKDAHRGSGSGGGGGGMALVTPKSQGSVSRLTNVSQAWEDSSFPSVSPGTLSKQQPARSSPALEDPALPPPSRLGFFSALWNRRDKKRMENKAGGFGTERGKGAMPSPAPSAARGGDSSSPEKDALLHGARSLQSSSPQDSVSPSLSLLERVSRRLSVETARLAAAPTERRTRGASVGSVSRNVLGEEEEQQQRKMASGGARMSSLTASASVSTEGEVAALVATAEVPHCGCLDVDVRGEERQPGCLGGK